MAKDYTTATFLAALLDSASSAIQPLKATDTDHTETNLNPLSNETLPSSARTLLLTLHVLYPTQFLPALDILDRRLLTRLIPPSSTQPPSAEPPSPPSRRTHHQGIYLVRSAAATSTSTQPPHDASAATTSTTSRFHDVLAPQVYEVRLRAGNCSCPAFVFAAFPAAADDDDDDDGDVAEAGVGEEQEELEWLAGENDALGGLRRGKGSHELAMC